MVRDSSDNLSKTATKDEVCRKGRLAIRLGDRPFTVQYVGQLEVGWRSKSAPATFLYPLGIAESWVEAGGTSQQARVCRVGVYQVRPQPPPVFRSIVVQSQLCPIPVQTKSLRNAYSRSEFCPGFSQSSIVHQNQIQPSLRSALYAMANLPESSSRRVGCFQP